jgi:hypothetical protein
VSKNEEQPIDVNELRKDEDRINQAGRSGDKVVDALKEMFDQGR